MHVNTQLINSNRLDEAEIDPRVQNTLEHERRRAAEQEQRELDQKRRGYMRVPRVKWRQRWEWLALCFGCNPIPVEAVHVF